MRRAITLTVAAAAFVGTMGTTASAAPPERPTLTLTCGGESYTLAGTGGGFGAARLLDGGVFVPVEFGAFSVTVNGTVVEAGDEVEVKGRGNPAANVPHEIVDCTFESSFTLTEPEEGFPAGSIVEISGEVSGFFRPN